MASSGFYTNVYKQIKVTKMSNREGNVTYFPLIFLDYLFVAYTCLLSFQPVHLFVYVYVSGVWDNIKLSRGLMLGYY